MRTQYKHGLVLFAALLTSGCSLLARPGGGVARYAPALLPHALPAPTHERRWQIAVAEPLAPAPLLGTRILVSPRPGHIEVYHAARWQEAPAVLLKSLIIQALHEAGAAGAADSASLQRTDFLLESDLFRFQSDYRDTPAPSVSIDLYVRLIRVADGQVAAARRFSVVEPAAGSAMPAVFEAFERAIDRLVRDCADWAVAAGDRIGADTASR
ncbi:cholesterol transport system auxiliary component [Tahibacter aquaticus]|uniref:Cholesterol transport system auxiliary component n=1 Tax=Tahibacter aquaticus TaxID=520092 RepID=A0A4R6YT55_9GAMM|nr:ABC-type transport auxiliary lipoprotein family protein [Tahibacter aquaticus]TDR41563.1 cholesterol transport system auxiliary component [Tahibacter aquaticus]